LIRRFRRECLEMERNELNFSRTKGHLVEKVHETSRNRIQRTMLHIVRKAKLVNPRDLWRIPRDCVRNLRENTALIEASAYMQNASVNRCMRARVLGSDIRSPGQMHRMRLTAHLDASNSGSTLMTLIRSTSHRQRYSCALHYSAGFFPDVGLDLARQLAEIS